MQQTDRQLANLNMLRGLQSDDYSRYNTDRAYNYGVYSDDWSRNFQTKQYADEQAQQALGNQRYDTQWGYTTGQDAKADAQNRIGNYLTAGGKVADLDPVLIAASGYTAAELAAQEKYYAEQKAKAYTQPVQTRNPGEAEDFGPQYSLVFDTLNTIENSLNNKTFTMNEYMERVDSVIRTALEKGMINETGAIQLLKSLGATNI